MDMIEAPPSAMAIHDGESLFKSIRRRLFIGADVRRLDEMKELPETDDQSPTMAIVDLTRRFQFAANDTFTDLLVVGWVAGAPAVIEHDPVLADKQITWLIQPEHLAWMARELGSKPWPRLRVALCEDHAQLPFLLETMPPCWSMTVLDDLLCPVDVLHNLGRTRFQRSRSPIARAIGDLHHLWHRLEVLPEAIPLGAWKGYYQGQSALCLAAGPSLDRHLDFIRAHMDRCVVIVVDVLQRKLQEQGIKIDFVMTVDSDERLTHRLVEPADPGTVMIMPLLGHRALDRKFPKRSHFCGGLIGHWLLGDPHSFPTGTTVGIASVGFASFLGCKEALLLGHDLAFSTTSYYSQLVAGRETHQVEMLAESTQSIRRVPGNDGGQVTTDYLFEVGIQDLGIMLRSIPDLVVYNRNMNDGIGARIPCTKAVPDDWVPASEEALTRPDSARRLSDDIAKDLKPLLRTKMTEQMEYAAILWKQQREQGISPIAIDQVMNSHGWSAIGANYLNYIYHGVLMRLMRLYSLPPSIGTGWYRAEGEAQITAILDKGREFILQVLNDQNPPPLFSPLPLSEKRAKFYMAVFNAINSAGEAPADAILIPVLSRSLRDLRRVLPDEPFPCPQSASEGLSIIRGCGENTPDRYVSQTLCLCALEGLDQPIGWAQSTEYLPSHLLPSDTSGRRKRGAYPELDATDAVLRLRQGGSTSLKGDISLALSWPPAHLHLLRALLGLGEPGIDQLDKLLKRGDLTPDDQMISLIILHVADFNRACHLVHPFTKALGEATMLAMAQRHCERGDHDAALKICAGVRVLSRFFDQAQTIVCMVQQARGDFAAMRSACSRIRDPQLASHWHSLADQAEGGHAAVLEQVLKDPRLPSPAVLSRLCQQAWKDKDQQSLESIFRLILRRSQDPGIAPVRSQYKELATHLETLLKSLGVDVATITQVELAAVMKA